MAGGDKEVKGADENEIFEPQIKADEQRITQMVIRSFETRKEAETRSNFTGDLGDYGS